MKVLVLSNSGTPWNVASQASLSMELSRQENWSGLPFPSPGDLPNPGIESRSPELQADSLVCEPPGSPRQTELWGNRGCPVSRQEAVSLERWWCAVSWVMRSTGFALVLSIWLWIEQKDIGSSPVIGHGVPALWAFRLRPRLGLAAFPTPSSQVFGFELELHNSLSWASSLQRAGCGTSQPSWLHDPSSHGKLLSICLSVHRQTLTHTHTYTPLYWILLLWRLLSGTPAQSSDINRRWNSLGAGAAGGGGLDSTGWR